jgi:hypothetical protein
MHARALATAAHAGLIRSLDYAAGMFLPALAPIHKQRARGTPHYSGWKTGIGGAPCSRIAG